MSPDNALGPSDKWADLGVLGQTLRELGLSYKQAKAVLESVAVTRHVLLEAKPTMTSQRDALKDMADALKLIEKAFNRVQDLTDREGLGLALRSRLERAHCESDDVSQVIYALLDAVASLRFTVAHARRSMPKTQGRRRVPTLPAQLVHEALGPSVTLGSKLFEDVMQIVYDEAVGAEDEAAVLGIGNPEAAIRKYRKRVIAG